MTARKLICLATVGILACAGSAQASMVLSTMNVAVTENFDGLISSGSTAMIGTVGLVQSIPGSGGFDGTKTGGTGATLVLNADNGATTGATSGNLHSLGATGSSERALGTLASGTTFVAMGVELVNSTGATITSILIEFYREQWRSNTSVVNIGACAYAASGGTADSSNYLTDGGVTPCPSLDMVSEAPVTSAGALDGNDGAHRVLVSASLSVSIPNGDSLFIRWNDPNDSGTDASMGIDDLSITPSPEPATIALLGLGALALIRRRRA